MNYRALDQRDTRSGRHDPGWLGRRTYRERNFSVAGVGGENGMPKTFVIAADGNVSPSRRELAPEDLMRESRLPAITEKLHNPHFSAVELQLLIAEESALVIQEMKEYAHRPDGAPNVQYCAGLLNALHGLGKQVQLADAIRKHDDLNFDSPKLKFVLREFAELFKQAARDALGKDSDTQVRSIMIHFHDLASMNEARIRSEVKKMGNGAEDIPFEGTKPLNSNA